MTRSTHKRPLTWVAIGALALVFAAAPVQFGPSLDVDAWANGSHPGGSGPGGGNPGSSGPGASGPGNGDGNGK
jgi:hypothetical protein